jgi:hypothetical protein
LGSNRSEKDVGESVDRSADRSIRARQVDFIGSSWRSRDARPAAGDTTRLTQNFEYCSNFPDGIPRIVAAAIRSLAR